MTAAAPGVKGVPVRSVPGGTVRQIEKRQWVLGDGFWKQNGVYIQRELYNLKTAPIERIASYPGFPHHLNIHKKYIENLSKAWGYYRRLSINELTEILRSLGVYIRLLVGHCLATKVFIGKLPATGGVWVIIG